MRITILTDRYAPEARAAAYLAQELAEGLARRGHAVTVVTRKPTAYVPVDAGTAADGERQLNGVNIVRLEGSGGGQAIWKRALDQILLSMKATWRMLREEKAEVIFVYSPPLALTLPAVAGRLVRRIPFVLNLHDLYPQTAIDLGVLRNPGLIYLLRLFEKGLYLLSGRILVAAPASLRILRSSGVAEEKLRILYNYVRRENWAVAEKGNQYRKRLGLEEQFVVLYAGLMGLAQDIGVVIQCARRMQGEAGISFLLVGDGPRADEWRKAATGLSNVKMMGPVSSEEYFSLVSEADVCLAPLHADFKAPAIPGKVSTILACGRPIIALVPEDNDTRGVIRESACGFALDCGDVEGLTRAVKTLESNRAMAIEMGKRGNEFARINFSIDGALGQCEQALQQVRDARRASSSLERAEAGAEGD